MNIIRIIEQLDVIFYREDLILYQVQFISRVQAKLSIEFNHYGSRSALNI